MDSKDKVHEPGFVFDVLDSMPGLIAVVRARDLKVVFVNQLFQHYFGYSNSDLDENQLLFTDILDDYQVDRLFHHLSMAEKIVASRTSYVIYRMANRERVFANFYLFVSPHTGASGNGEKLYNLLLMPDLSTWSMPFTSFATRELFLEQFQSEDFGTFEWVIGADKVYWSRGIYNIYEVDESVKDIDQAFARSFAHPLDRDFIAAESAKAAATKSKLNLEFRIITAKQNVKVIHSLAKTIFGDDGQPVKFVGSIRDVSSQRSIEQDLKNKVEELYHSNRELEEFAFVASHDMQEPLRKITTFGSRLIEKYSAIMPDEGQLYLSRISASAESMRKLIDDLLEFSRISLAKQSFVNVDLNSTLRQVLADLELVIEETGTTIKSTNLPEVVAISSQMKQLFANIISNSIKFRKAEQAPCIEITSVVLSAIEVEKYELPPGQVYNKVVIRDNGIGFEDEYAIRIFKVFQRLHGKSEYPGSGIGLAICKKIVDHHNGVIFAESNTGKGSCFTFVIPEKHSMRS